jgi:hypothetical protein
VSQWPKRRNTVRTWTFERLHESETFCSVGFECEDCSAWLLPVQFTFSTLRSATSLSQKKEMSLLSRESQQRQPPLPVRSPHDSKALRHRSLPHPDLRCYEATLRIPETTFLPMRASLDPFFLQRNSTSRYDQVVQRLSTTMKTVAKGILKDHLIPAARSTTCSGNLNGFNNAGYKATFRPLKVPVPLTESTLFTPMKCLRRLQRDAILIHWDVWSHHVRGASMQYSALDHLLRLCNENQQKKKATRSMVIACMLSWPW